MPDPESSSISFPSPQSWPSAVDGGCQVSLRSPSFKIRREHIGDIATRNLVSLESAVAYFQNFFIGCDRFVPVFDPDFDTFGSVRARSYMLFDIICTVGCRMTTGPSSQIYQLLDNDSKRRVCEVLVGSVAASLEAVQALLIVASYLEKGWMLTSIATLWPCNSIYQALARMLLGLQPAWALQFREAGIPVQEPQTRTYWRPVSKG